MALPQLHLRCHLDALFDSRLLPIKQVAAVAEEAFLQFHFRHQLCVLSWVRRPCSRSLWPKSTQSGSLQCGLNGATLETTAGPECGCLSVFSPPPSPAFAYVTWLLYKLCLLLLCFWLLSTSQPPLRVLVATQKVLPGLEPNCCRILFFCPDQLVVYFS